jgi:hypothetical protein
MADLILNYNPFELEYCLGTLKALRDNDELKVATESLKAAVPVTSKGKTPDNLVTLIAVLEDISGHIEDSIAGSIPLLENARAAIVEADVASAALTGSIGKGR